MSSGRGPGVIGTVMALLVVCGFGLLFVFVFDEGLQGGGETIESVIASQAKEMDGYQTRINNADEVLATVPALQKVSKDLAAVQRQSTFLAAEIEGLNKSVEVLNGQIAEKNEAFAAYKDEYREHVRGKAVGMKYPELKTADGTVYTDVEVREVTAVGIQIRHDAGQKRIPFEDLPEEMKDYYQFDPEQKQEALIAERENRKAHETEVALAHEAAGKAMAAQKERDLVAARQKLQRDIANSEARASQLRREISELKKEIRRENSKTRGVSRAGILQPQLQAKERQMNALLADIRRMKASL